MVHPALTRRWAFFESYQVSDERRVLLYRLRIIQTPLGGLYLHMIPVPDSGPRHAHPWWFASVVLAGGYTELLWDSPGAAVRTRRHRRFRPRVMRLDQMHRITGLDGPTWTLVLAGPYSPSWLARWRDT